MKKRAVSNRPKPSLTARRVPGSADKNERPTPAERQHILASIQQLSPIPEEELKLFGEALHLLSFEAGEPFVRAGDSADRVGVVISGLFKVFYSTPEGDDWVCNFHPEGSFVGAYAGSLSGTPSRTSTVAAEASRVAWIPFSFLPVLFARHPVWERFGRRVAEILYVRMVQREECLMSQNADSRLETFRGTFPGLIDRARKADIASYLNIRPETLSRLLNRSR